MSTRANIVVTDQYDSLWFYRHSDGYPSVAGESLKRFLRWLLAGKIRDNVGQAAGWLIALGAIEYQTIPATMFPQSSVEPSYKRDGAAVQTAIESFSPKDWKVGAYEPTTGIHGDIEYLYVVDLKKREIRCFSARSLRPAATDNNAYPDPKFDPANEPPRAFYTVTASNIDTPIEEAVEA